MLRSDHDIHNENNDWHIHQITLSTQYLPQDLHSKLLNVTPNQKNLMFHAFIVAEETRRKHIQKIGCLNKDTLET